MRAPEYYIDGLLPVKFVPTADGGVAILKMSWDTGAFEHAPELQRYIYHATGDVRAVSEEQFLQHVEAMRARRLSGDGPVYALYQVMNGIEDVAREEGRELTADEERLLAQLRRESAALFARDHPDPT